jgi:hypothetical protein
MFRRVRNHRSEDHEMTEREPSKPRRTLRSGGVDGNERLTAMVAALLLVLLFLAGLTVPIANAQTRLHVFLGVVVIPPVFLNSSKSRVPRGDSFATTRAISRIVARVRPRHFYVCWGQSLWC